MTIKLYYDFMSQPSRALYILLKASKCNFEPKYVDVRKGEHLSEAYSKINRFNRVPVIDHNGFVLTESVAIMNYLSREGIVPESLYPKDSKHRARVEEYLEWQHVGFRFPLAWHFRVKVLFKEPDQKRVASYEKRMVAALEEFEAKWLDKSTFLTGETPTVADLLAACEVEQPRMADFDPSARYPKIAAWLQKVRQHFNPHFDEAHVVVNKIAAKYNKQAKL
ncbi:hypothetical protein NE865_11483 [Phthorimaea operculella]|nr:hypothetical protein NE865_11483 [Phthorimaea operculella]